MITSVLAVLVHGGLLYVAVAVAVGFYGQPIRGLPPEQAAVAITVLVMGSLLLVSLTPGGEWFVSWRYGCKRPTPGELSIMGPCWQTVAAIGGVDPDGYRLRIVHSRDINAYAIGNSTIAVTSGCLYDTTPNELRGVLAHELGHHMHGDTVYSAITVTAEQVGIGVYNAIALVNRIVAVGTIIPFLGLVIAVVVLTITLLLKLFNWFVLWPWSMMYFLGSRRSEYAADRYACRLGYGEGLRSFLTRCGDSSGWWASLRSTHPGAGARIKRIDKIIYG